MTKEYAETTEIVIKPNVTRFQKNWDLYASPYAYAANEPKLTFRMPGDLSGPSLWAHKYAASFKVGDALVEGLLRDGWLKAQKADLEDQTKHIVAVTAHPAFHLFGLHRRDEDGSFSFKDMKSAPNNVASNGQSIRDLEAVTRKTSEHFLGHFVMPASGLNFKPQ